MTKQEMLDLVVAAYRLMEKIDKTLVELFNKYTGLYDGDDLFATATSSICKHWVPRAPKVSEDLFMNYNCNHPNGDKDWFDTDHCSIMNCPDEKHCTQTAGTLASMHSQLHPIQMTLIGDIFNDNLSNNCEHAFDEGCAHPGREVDYCVIAKCPLGKETE